MSFLLYVLHPLLSFYINFSESIKKFNEVHDEISLKYLTIKQ